MKKGICRFCGKEKELIKAHIIPKNFYIDYKTDKYKAVDSLTGKWTSIQCGVYDENILCSACDNSILRELDNYGYKILLKSVYKNIYQKDKENCCAIYKLVPPEYNYLKLRKFLISILWRASVSKIIDYEGVKLGAYEKYAYEVINGIEEHLDKFTFFIFKTPLNKLFSKVNYIKCIRFEKTRAYEIDMATYQVIIIPNSKVLSMNLKYSLNLFFANKKRLYILESDEIYYKKVESLYKYSSKWKK